MAKWITKSEYSRKYDLNRSSVTKAVQNGRLPSRGNKVDGDVDIRKYRRREPANDDAAFAVPAASPRRTSADIAVEDLGEELQRARIDKLNADIIIQKQKDIRTRQSWRREDLAEFTAAFVESFSPFRSAVVKFRLTTDQLASVSAAWDSCWQTFTARLEDLELADNATDPDQTVE